MDYMTASSRYPIATREKDIVPMLNDLPDCCAVVLRDPDLAFDPSSISVVRAPDLAKRYWEDKTATRGRLVSAPRAYTSPVTEDIIRAEADAARIQFNSAASLTQFTGICNHLRGVFSRTFARYSGIENAVMRDFPLFTPIGGLGRSPELHVDNTKLSLHWSAAKSTFPVVDDELDDDTWRRLDRGTQSRMPDDERSANFQHLVNLGLTLPMVENQVGDVMITRGQLGRDLTNPKERRGLCVHVSSRTITKNGQAGFLMTPKMPDPANIVA